ncbi:MAG: hypothetical protein ACKV0T_03170 [Planctomycetales bacterium]
MSSACNIETIRLRWSCEQSTVILTSPVTAALLSMALFHFYHELRIAAASCVSAAVILGVVRWLNPPDRPRFQRYREIADVAAVVVIAWLVSAAIVVATWPTISNAMGDRVARTVREMVLPSKSHVAQ